MAIEDALVLGQELKKQAKQSAAESRRRPLSSLPPAPPIRTCTWLGDAFGFACDFIQARPPQQWCAHELHQAASHCSRLRACRKALPLALRNYNQNRLLRAAAVQGLSRVSSAFLFQCATPAILCPPPPLVFGHDDSPVGVSRAVSVRLRAA